ncbi:lipid IV(A) 3-deoxy-D-manno-octulosonic acid transferase [Bartonella ancashensis]|uniref:3-deoxy-D-manno-octulosonic acid transferase n=1 Tax=Bartonella ancashensis TaxID=1318743 RepID=A0A0M4LGC6_9HYPH|nr:lipid IV(A) 3-deoxy-D-manno-octulosonic acid transferase [Bartonella ancashensis]ALE03469.1 3-deoxy-D-manno-octulosonic-acid transferase [Bartonella ancashensis]
MMKLKARAAISLYRAIGFCLYIFVSFYLFVRVLRGKEEVRRRKERFGKSQKLRPSGPLVWFHAASVGETQALLPLIEYILSLNINVLLTTCTVASSSFIKNRFGERLIHQYAPLDLELIIHRFINHWKPDLVLTCESEIWPLRIIALSEKRIPQIWVNAHMSERSFQVWQRMKAFSEYIFQHINMVVGQNERDVAYYQTLGAKSVVLSGNLKADVVPFEDQELLTRYHNFIRNRPIWAAVSTHEGEEEIALEVHKTLKNYWPDLLTIIVPRHIERTEAIMKVCDREGIQYVCRSSNIVPDSQTDVLLGDTVGEMGLFLRLSKVAFIGKSLCSSGGHNPLELAFLGAVIVTGPNFSNFQDIFEQFLSHDAACVVENKIQLALQINVLLGNEVLRQEMADKAYKVATGMAGAFECTRRVLYPFLQPLIIQKTLNRC